MDLNGIHFVIAAILLFVAVRAQHNTVNNDNIGSAIAEDVLIRMEKKMGAMETRIELVERELKDHKEVNMKLTLKVADLTHQMSAKRQSVICNRCMKKASSSKKSAMTYFNKLVPQSKQQIQHKQPPKNINQYGMIQMLIQAWKTQEERLSVLEATFTETPTKGKSHDDTPSVGNVTMANVQHRRYKEGDTNRPGRSLATSIAFTAYLDHELVDMGAGEIIQMKGIILNEGSGYNKYSGIFSAPQAGVYMFSYAIVDNHGTPTKVDLLVNGSKRVGAITNTRYGGFFQQGGNLAILRLTAGESVWLASVDSGDDIYGTSGSRYSTFSGVFLYA